MQKYTTFSANSKSGRLFFGRSAYSARICAILRGSSAETALRGGMTGGSFVAGGV